MCVLGGVLDIKAGFFCLFVVVCFFLTMLVWKFSLLVVLLETVLVCRLLQGGELISRKLALGVVVVLCMNLSWGNPQLNLGYLHQVLLATPL